MLVVFCFSNIGFQKVAEEEYKKTGSKQQGKFTFYYKNNDYCKTSQVQQVISDSLSSISSNKKQIKRIGTLLKDIGSDTYPYPLSINIDLRLKFERAFLMNPQAGCELPKMLVVKAPAAYNPVTCIEDVHDFSLFQLIRFTGYEKRIGPTVMSDETLMEYLQTKIINDTFERMTTERILDRLIKNKQTVDDSNEMCVRKQYHDFVLAKLHVSPLPSKIVTNQGKRKETSTVTNNKRRKYTTSRRRITKQTAFLIKNI